MARNHSELEGFVLGLVWQLGPASAYEIRRHMQTSPSTQWSASAGSIYPLMRRLERAGLLKSRERSGGGRGGREYTITAKGQSALREWVGPPLGAAVVTVAHDPLRSRARFLGALPREARLEWISGTSPLDRRIWRSNCKASRGRPRASSSNAEAMRGHRAAASSARARSQSLAASAKRPRSLST